MRHGWPAPGPAPPVRRRDGSEPTMPPPAPRAHERHSDHRQPHARASLGVASRVRPTMRRSPARPRHRCPHRRVEQCWRSSREASSTSRGSSRPPRLGAGHPGGAVRAAAAAALDPRPDGARRALAALRLDGPLAPWAPIGGQAQDDLQRMLLYARPSSWRWRLPPRRRCRRWLEPALALAAFMLVAYALSERLLPGLIELERSGSAAGRLEQPFTYWNAVGIAAALGLHPRRPRRR